MNFEGTPSSQRSPLREPHPSDVWPGLVGDPRPVLWALSPRGSHRGELQWGRRCVRDSGRLEWPGQGMGRGQSHGAEVGGVLGGTGSCTRKVEKSGGGQSQDPPSHTSVQTWGREGTRGNGMGTKEKEKPLTTSSKKPR